MLFQSYPGGRPAEFVHSSKGKASQDPLGEGEDAKKRERGEATEEDYDDESDAGDGPDVDDLFNSDDDDDAVDEDIDEDAGYDSGYGTEERDITMTEGTDDCYATEVDELGQPVRQACDDAELDEFGEAIRKYRALCYEDICL